MRFNTHMMQQMRSCAFLFFSASFRICLMALSTATIKDPKQMLPKLKVIALLNESKTGVRPTLSPWNHHALTAPQTTQWTTLEMTLPPQ